MYLLLLIWLVNAICICECICKHFTIPERLSKVYSYHTDSFRLRENYTLRKVSFFMAILAMFTYFYRRIGNGFD